MRRLENKGQAIIEYFVLALLLGLATVLYWLRPSGFLAARLGVESAFDHSVTRILAP